MNFVVEFGFRMRTALCMRGEEENGQNEEEEEEYGCEDVDGETTGSRHTQALHLGYSRLRYN